MATRILATTPSWEAKFAISVSLRLLEVLRLLEISGTVENIELRLVDTSVTMFQTCSIP